MKHINWNRNVGVHRHFQRYNSYTDHGSQVKSSQTSSVPLVQCERLLGANSPLYVVVSCATYCIQRAAIFVQQLQAFQRDGKYSRGENVVATNIFITLENQQLLRKNCSALRAINCTWNHVITYKYVVRLSGRSLPYPGCRISSQPGCYIRLTFLHAVHFSIHRCRKNPRKKRLTPVKFVATRHRRGHTYSHGK